MKVMKVLINVECSEDVVVLEKDRVILHTIHNHGPDYFIKSSEIVENCLKVDGESFPFNLEPQTILFKEKKEELDLDIERSTKNYLHLFQGNESKALRRVMRNLNQTERYILKPEATGFYSTQKVTFNRSLSTYIFYEKCSEEELDDCQTYDVVEIPPEYFQKEICPSSWPHLGRPVVRIHD